jgi:hypothetical protein
MRTRLIGSKTEDDFRADLTTSRNNLMHATESSLLRSILQQRNPDLSQALVIDWIPEQGEDIYEVLHCSEVLQIEIPHEGTSHSIECVPLETYLRRRLGRPKRIKLAVALDMLEK